MEAISRVSLLGFCKGLCQNINLHKYNVYNTEFSTDSHTPIKPRALAKKNRLYSLQLFYFAIKSLQQCVLQDGWSRKSISDKAKLQAPAHPFLYGIVTLKKLKRYIFYIAFNRVPEEEVMIFVMDRSDRDYRFITKGCIYLP